MAKGRFVCHVVPYYDRYLTNHHPAASGKFRSERFRDVATRKVYSITRFTSLMIGQLGFVRTQDYQTQSLARANFQLHLTVSILYPKHEREIAHLKIPGPVASHQTLQYTRASRLISPLLSGYEFLSVAEQRIPKQKAVTLQSISEIEDNGIGRLSALDFDFNRFPLWWRR